jgi:XTP/dITP diphosphohydrolase
MSAFKKLPRTPRAIDELLRVMARLRAPGGCPWDRQQTHRSIRLHAIEEVYELLDAIEARDDGEMAEELGDMLLQVVFHCQLARERGAFDFEQVARHLVDKLIRRHPHVFGDSQARSIDAVWAQWDRIKRAEKAGTRHARPSVLDGVPRHLPALMRAEKFVKKARKAGLIPSETGAAPSRKPTKAIVARQLFALVAQAQKQGWCAEELLRVETRKNERVWRKQEKKDPVEPGPV